MVFSSLTRTAYAIAVLGVLLMVGVRMWIGPALGPNAALALFALPVLVAAWLGGLRPGIIATALGALGAVYTLAGPWDASHLVSGANQVRVIAFTVLGLVASYGGEALQGFRKRQEMEHQALAMRRQWEAILGGIPTPFYTLDENLRFVFVSDRFVELVAINRAAMLGKTVREVWGDSIADTFEGQLRESATQARPLSFDYHHSASDRWFENRVYPFSTGVAVLVSDITERKRAEDALRSSEDRFRMVTNNAPVAIFIKDLDGRYTLANPLACEALGRPDGVIGRTDYDLMARGVADELRRNDLEVISTGESIEREERVVGPHGDQMYLSVKFPLLDHHGKAVGVCGVALNITARKSAEEAQALLAAIVASSDDAIISKSLTGTILSWNARAERLFGYSASEAIGKSINLIVPPERQGEEDTILERLRRGERIEHFETVRVSKRGRYIDVSLTNSLLRDGMGRVVGASAILRNITERKQAEELLRQSEEQFHLLADSIPNLAWMARADGHVFWYNQRWYEYTGRTPKEMQEQGWQSLIDPAEAPRVVEKWREALASHEPWEDTFLVRRHDGAMRWHLSRALPLKDENGRIVRWFGTNTDITEQREMADTLRDADRRKDEFLATLAHELRNPLAPIRSSLQILRLTGTVDPNVRRVRDVMERQVDHLVRLVDDLLDVSRITRGKIELRTELIDVATIVRNAVECSSPAIEAHGHQLAITLPPEPLFIEADVVRMAQVLANLLNNAAKFTPEGGQIWVTARREGNEVVLAVRDSGPGMGPELVPHVFELFTQGEHSPGRTQGGLGIGLTLVKSLTELHGGSVEARSAGLGHGSEFVIRLPQSALSGARPRPAPNLPHEIIAGPPKSAESVEADLAPSSELAAPAEVDRPSGRRVLIVDDYKDAASALGLLLQALGTEVRLAHSGPDALAAIDDYRPEVILLDIGMPGMDGYEVARRIRENDPNRSIMLIALTGWGQENDRERSREAGFDHHLLKPVDFREIEELLGSLDGAKSSAEIS